MSSFEIHLEKTARFPKKLTYTVAETLKGTLTIKGKVNFGTDFTFWYETQRKMPKLASVPDGSTTGGYSNYELRHISVWEVFSTENLIPILKQVNTQNTSKSKKEIAEYSFSIRSLGSSVKSERHYLKAKLNRRHKLDKNFKKQIKII